jgi:hypothetical protein
LHLGLLLPTALYFLTFNMELVAMLGIALMVLALAVILMAELTGTVAAIKAAPMAACYALRLESTCDGYQRRRPGSTPGG